MQKIAIDIGHADGTSASSNGVNERDVCEPVAYILASKLTQTGYKVRVFDSPLKSNSLDISNTVEEINAYTPDLVISLHCDSSDNTEAKGAHSIYFPASAKGKVFSDILGANLGDILGGRDLKSTSRNLQILRETHAPAVLAELGFLTNSDDREFIKSVSGQAIIAQVILDSIHYYFNDI